MLTTIFDDFHISETIQHTLIKVKFKTSINQSYWQTIKIGYNNSTGTFALSPSHRGAFLLIVHIGSESTDFHAIGKKNAGNAQQKCQPRASIF
jgi:hypothetical protein